MRPTTLTWVAEALAAPVDGVPGGPVEEVSVDSRSVRKNSLFFALPGERTDGHRFVAEAFRSGAAGAVVSRVDPAISGPQICVHSTTQALGDLAHAYRMQFSIPVIGITGSVGKTSTRSMAQAVLETRFTTLPASGNYNTEIGMPLTLFGMDDSQGAAVLEMGMRGTGQIAQLAAIASPLVGCITGIGYSHLALLGSREAIARAKGELLQALPDSGCAILPHDDPYRPLLESLLPPGCRRVTFGPWNEADMPDVAGYQVSPDRSSGQTATIVAQDQASPLRLPVPGSHHVRNALAAIAIGLVLGVPLADATAALASWHGAQGRLEIRRRADGLVILDDCYNAAPESMCAALEVLSERAEPQRIAILGDMRELGDYAEQAHRQVGAALHGARVDQIVTVGELASLIAEEASSLATAEGTPAPRVLRFADARSAAAAAPGLISPPAAVLVKGSRALEMETIVDALLGVAPATRHA